MTQVHRRTLLKSSVPVLMGAIATGAIASELAGKETKIQSLYVNWEKFGNRYGNLISESDALFARLTAEGNPDAEALTDEHYSKFVDPACDDFLRVEVRIMRTPAQDFKDLAIKARISARVDGTIDDEYNRLIREDAERLLGKVDI